MPQRRRPLQKRLQAGRRSAVGFEHALALLGAGEEAEAEAILEELGVPPPPAQTAARTAK